MKARLFFSLGLTGPFVFWLMSAHASLASYDLHRVNGIEAFGGSAHAKEILGRNGFVVADPVFKQIFEPYIKSPQTKEPSEKRPMGESLPSFITTDSAWHTYHVLLEEGVKELEGIEAHRLLKFSGRLWAAAKQQTGSDARDLALFASVGLALQDEQHRKSLANPERRLVEGLRTGTAEVDVPIGFRLSPFQFRAQSFYTQSPELSDYFAARQWYSSVVFRLADARETRLAVALAVLVNNDVELLTLWKQLSGPFDSLLAPAEDGTVPQYADAVKALLGSEANGGALREAQVLEIQTKLQAQLSLPRISDQLLSPEEYAQFDKVTRGFRLLPPRRLPCAVCFHNTIDPKIPNRRYPSGLDFLAASPVLRSPAAVRAVENQFGKTVSQLILKADCGPMPDSLYGEAMQLLALLQKPLPSQAPASMRNDAWSDLQLWTQLGAWAEQRHTWALHAKLTFNVAGIITPPKGMVAPYPEFFSGLAALSRRTATALEMAGLAQRFEVKTAAVSFLEALNLSQGSSGLRDGKEFEKNSAKLEQLGQFRNRYDEEHKAELEKQGPDAWKKLEDQLRDLAQRCANRDGANEADTATLRLFYDCRQDIVRLLNEFAPVCDRLAGLAKKPLTGQALNEEDAKWIENYGVTLAAFHFYYGNSYEVPADNFPIVTRVFSNPLTDSMLYAGLARPQALYVIASDGKANQLYRGAVMTYREFIRPNDQLLDDDSWRELVSTGQAPPAPPFTRSFCAEASIADLINRLRSQSGEEDARYGDIEETLLQISSRATAGDLPQLLKVMTHEKGEERSDIVEGMAEIIARLPWAPYRKQLIDLLAVPDHVLADAAAHILIARPGSLDPAEFISTFKRQPVRTRRLYCAILGRLPQQTEATRAFLLGVLQDPADGVRWQAVLAIKTANWKEPQSISALVACLADRNELVGASAAFSLAHLGATNTAPQLLAALSARLKSPPTATESRLPHVAAIVDDIRGEEHHPDQILNVDNLAWQVDRTVPPTVRKMATMRLPPQPAHLHFPAHNFNLADALIEALGELQYAPAADELFKLRGTDYDVEATRALSKIVPERLTAELLAKALDKQADSYLREQALVTLCNLSMTNRVRDIVPLLDDVTPIAYDRRLPGPEWRICDRATVAIALMLGWEHPMMLQFIQPQKREELMKRAREWAKSGP